MRTFIQKIGLRRLLLSILALSIFIAGYYAMMNWIFAFSPKEFLVWYTSFEKPVRPFSLAALFITTLVIAPLDGSWLIQAIGDNHGPIQGFIFSYSTVVIGSYLAFEVGRFIFQPIVKALVLPERFTSWTEKIHQARWGMYALYMIPLFPYDVLSFILGPTGMPRKLFIKILMIGAVPNVLLLTLYSRDFSNPLYTNILIVVLPTVAGYFAINWLAGNRSESPRKAKRNKATTTKTPQ